MLIEMYLYTVTYIEEEDDSICSDQGVILGPNMELMKKYYGKDILTITFEKIDDIISYDEIVAIIAEKEKWAKLMKKNYMRN